MKPLRIIFCGTPEFACPTLEWLIDSQRAPVLVLTQPDRPAGRGRRVSAGPVKRMAQTAGIEVAQPPSLRDPALVTRLRTLQPDLLITAAYGLLVPEPVLALPVHGCWNLHGSLLPRWRGASPINQAILHGDAETGVSLMHMQSGLDTGPVYLQHKISIGAAETAGQLHDRLAALAATTLASGLERLESGCLEEPIEQDDTLATHAPRIAKSDARLIWSQSAERLARMVRAYNPWPVAFGDLEGQPIRVFEAWAEPETATGRPPGSVLPGSAEAVRVACGQGVLEITELQTPGRRRLSAREWLNAHAHRR